MPPARAAELSRLAHAPQAASGVEFDLIGNPIHENLPARATEDHNGISNDYIRNLVFGGLHGCITSFGILSVSRGAGFDASATLVVCVANILANAISIGLGEYISKSAEREVVGEEYKREVWEMQNYPEGEVHEMVQLYKEKYGFSQRDAQTVIETMSRYQTFFVDHMMQVELGLQSPGEINDVWKNALATVCTVIAFGIMPLAAYLLLHVVNPKPSFMFPFMIAATVFATCFILFTLGYTKAVFTRQPRLRSGLRMVLHADLALCVAVVAAYSMGVALSSFLETAFDQHK
jgi:VIT1/CCC1 family predicted Fe2+/Mn2+ transporter